MKEVFYSQVRGFILCEHRDFRQHEGEFGEKFLVVKQSTLELSTKSLQ